MLAARSASRLRSGTPLLSGLGILSSITVLFAVTTSWISASRARRTRPLLQVRSAPSLGESAITPSTSTASPDGSRHVRCAHWTTENGSTRGTDSKSSNHQHRTTLGTLFLGRNLGSLNLMMAAVGFISDGEHQCRRLSQQTTFLGPHKTEFKNTKKNFTYPCIK